MPFRTETGHCGIQGAAEEPSTSSPEARRLTILIGMANYGLGEYVDLCAEPGELWASG
jgi:hypothetical protein